MRLGGFTVLRTRVRRKVQRELSKFVYKSSIDIACPQPVVSFTFDDVYSSAVVRGARILEQSGIRGTYYVSMGLTGRVDSVGSYHSEDDIASLILAGHEVGCHTYSHLACGDVSKLAYLNDVVANGRRFEERFPRHRMRNFSFPFGQMAPSCKKLLAQHFGCLRSTQPGINVGKTDILMLKAHRLYEGSITLDRLRELIKLNSAANGWLIFYTHDVSDSPSRYGCTPELLRIAIDLALESGAHIRTVDRAFQFVQGCGELCAKSEN